MNRSAGPTVVQGPNGEPALVQPNADREGALAEREREERAMPSAAEAAHAIERVGLEGRLRRFIDRTRATAVSARKLAEAGDEEAKRLFWKAARILDKVRRLLDDDNLVAARAELVEAEALMTELAGLVTARQREIDPEQAAKAEQEEAERVAELISSAPGAIAARIRARRELIAAATHRHKASDGPLVPVIQARARETRPRRQEDPGAIGDRSPPRPSAGDDDPPDDELARLLRRAAGRRAAA